MDKFLSFDTTAIRSCASSYSRIHYQRLRCKGPLFLLLYGRVVELAEAIVLICDSKPFKLQDDDHQN